MPPDSRSPNRSRRALLWRAGVVGVLAGIASGLFGVGGGAVMVPGLVMLVGISQRLAHGTSLTAIVPIAIAAGLGYASAGEVDLVVAALVAAGALVGTPVGVVLLGRLPATWLRVGFAVVLVVTAVWLVIETGAGEGREAIGLLGALAYAGTGVVSGALAGLMGVGGGVIIVPALTLVFGFPLTLAKGTSLAVIVPTALLGTLRNRRQGTTDLGVGAVAGLAGVVAAAVASQVALGLDPRLGASLFAGLLVVVAAHLAWRAARDRGDPRS